MENDISPQGFASAVDDVKRYLACLSELGCNGFDSSKQSLDILSTWGKPRIRKASVQTPQGLDRISADLGDCRRCALSTRRNSLVFGTGNPNARLMFIGEAPGYDEDMQGRPFVGASGQLLTKMIEAMGLTRDQVYITHIVKCMPTQNRTPLPEEINACFPFVKQQIQAINPEVICTLGAFATQALLGKHEDVSRLRGRLLDYGPHKVMPTFHPDFLLRKPENKREAWEDLKKIMAVLGLNGLF